MTTELPEKPTQPPVTARRTSPGVLLGVLALLIAPIVLFLCWYGAVVALQLGNSDSVWTLATIGVLAGVIGLIGFGEHHGIRRRWTAAAVVAFMPAMAFWAVLLFLIALGIECEGADPCFN